MRVAERCGQKQSGFREDQGGCKSSMTRGKSRMMARKDILKSSEAAARRRARQKHYDRRQYDGHSSSELM